MLFVLEGLSLLLVCVLLLVQCSRCSAKVVRVNDTTKTSDRVCRQSRLSNGIRVATDAYKTDGGNKAKVTVCVSVGSRHETDDVNGIAHFTEHMLLKGHDMYETFRLCFEFSLLNGATGKELTRYKMECERKEDVGQVLSTLSDIMINPVISEINVERERVVIQEQFRIFNELDFFKFRRKFLTSCVQKLAFHPNPLSMFVEGQLYSNFSVMASDIRHFYATHYKTKNTIIIAAGEVDHDEIVRVAEEAFKEYPRGEVARVPVAVWRHDSRVCFTPEAREVFGMLAVQAPCRALPKNATIAVVVKLIEFFPESAYPAHLSVTEEECGMVESEQMWWSVQAFKEFTVIGRIFNANPGREVIVIAKLIAKWRYLAYDITEEHLTLAKECFYRHYHSKDLDRAAIRLALDMLHCGRAVSIEEDRARCEAITLPQFRSACKRLLLDGDFTFVAFGPPDSTIPKRDEMREALRRPKEED